MDARCHRSKPDSARARSGQVIVLFAVILIVLMAICVLAIDVGRLFVCKAELQNTVDAAALAGASQLTGLVSESEKALARQEAVALAAANRVSGQPLTLTDSDIQFGHYNSATGEFVPEDQSGVVDSIKVTGRRTSNSPEGPVNLFFGSLFGWNEVEINNVISVGTKPRRYVMFALDRSGSMCFDTSGVQRKSYYQDPVSPRMDASASGWYWFPKRAMRRVGRRWRYRTAWFYAKDDATGQIRTDFLPDYIRARLSSGRYFNFRPRDYPTRVMSGWIKVPAGVTIYGRYASPWHNWLADSYYHVISRKCGYATSTGPVEPLQSTMDAACAFVDLLRIRDDRAGLVTYGWHASTDQVLTSDFALLKTKLQSFAPCGATAEPDAMEAALDELIDSDRAEGFGHRVLILLTDGCANMLHGASYSNNTRTYDFMGTQVTTPIHPVVGAAMAEQAQRARDNGVRTYCVTFGSDVDTEVHQVIAAQTNAAYYHSSDYENLTDMFLDIFRRLPPIITQ